MGPQRSRWRCPKRDGPGQIEELAVEIGFRFVNRMSHLATPDAFESRNHIQRDSKCQGSKTSGTWNSTLRLFVPLLTTKAQWQQSISLGMRRIFETTFEPSHGFRPNYRKNRMEGQKRILCADVKALSIERLTLFFIYRGMIPSSENRHSRTIPPH